MIKQIYADVISLYSADIGTVKRTTNTIGKDKTGKRLSAKPSQWKTIESCSFEAALAYCAYKRGVLKDLSVHGNEIVFLLKPLDIPTCHSKDTTHWHSLSAYAYIRNRVDSLSDDQLMYYMNAIVDTK